jgi:hypothetical protein
MKKHLATLALGLAVGFAALPLFSGTASAHGCHRDVQADGRGAHRHAQNDCDRLNVERGDRDRREYRSERRDYREDRREHRHERYCVEKCKYIGPFKECHQECGNR